MNIKYRVLRVVLFASTALTLGAELARAQTTDGKALSLDIGTVVANGTQNGTGNVALRGR
jgi:hypothetical protein